ncbi:MAG: TonB-dependent receptor [Saprospiraceae bacterium]|nr:TonB-dependent receptor [Saprospiraceae bacterium]MDZ4706010.1 TonB-dependent receptor [Saprospiraceae bacterium]
MVQFNTWGNPSGRHFLRVTFLSFFILILLGFGQTAEAQQIAVSGTVLSSEDGLPLIGVSVVEKGIANGTITDLDGKYQLSAASSATLIFSYIGFETEELPLRGRASLNLTMRSSATLLQSVVVTGYRKEIHTDVASSIASVKGKDLEKLVVLGLDQALQGQAPGLMVTQTTGAPGDDIAVRIRGAGTLGNNNPLFIIDGVPTTGNINMFSTNDIESIEVLKDGAAAAIYGARAANGVIVITTKKGKAGAPKFSFNSSLGFSNVYRLPELLNSSEYLTIRNEAIKNANVLRDLPRQLDTFDIGMLDTLANVNWLDEMFNQAPIQRYSLSATGGSESSNYYIQGEYFNQQGTFRGQGFEKYSLRFNGEAGSKRFKIGSNIAFAYTDRKVINSSGDGFGPGNEPSGIRYALIAAPVFDIRNPDGSYLNTSTGLGDPLLYGDGNANPLAFVDATDWTIKRYRIFGNVFAELTLFEGLKLRTNVGGDFLFENEKRFKERLSAAIYSPTSLTESRVFDQNLVWNNVADFQRSFGKHRVFTLLGMEAIQNRTTYLGASANNFSRTDPLFRYLDNSIPLDIQNIGASGIVTEWALLSFFAQAGYTFDNRYVINASVRRDGSSRFGTNNRFGVFPSVSAAWNVSNEPWFESVNFISALKLRASWGRLGNQEIGVYPFSSLVQTGNRIYSFGGQIVTGAQLVETGNSNIRWETSTQTDFGLDISVWNDRLSFIVDYYHKLTDGILVRVPVPQAGGATNPPYVNAGEIENKGLELGIIFKNKSRNFNYSIGANISSVQNKVLSLADSEPILGGFGLSDGPITRSEPGRPIGSFYLWEMTGIFQTQEEIEASPFQTNDTRPGDVKFADLNGDNKIDDKDRAHFGSPFPDFIYGLNVGINWKNFDLSVLAQGVQGNDVYFLYGNFAYETQARGFNSYREILNRWTPTNTDTDIPKVSIDDRNGNRRASTRFLEDGSYLRIRNITLGYNFKNLINTDAIGGLRVYVTVQNAFTFTNYPGLDPEIQANTNDTRGINIASDLAVGIDWGTVPASRTILAGLSLDF